MHHPISKDSKNQIGDLIGDYFDGYTPSKLKLCGTGKGYFEIETYGLITQLSSRELISDINDLLQRNDEIPRGRKRIPQLVLANECQMLGVELEHPKFYFFNASRPSYFD